MRHTFEHRPVPNQIFKNTCDDRMLVLENSLSTKIIKDFSFEQDKSYLRFFTMTILQVRLSVSEHDWCVLRKGT